MNINLPNYLNKATLTCAVCFSVLSSNLNCTNSNCPEKQSDVPTETQNQPLNPFEVRNIISTATGSAVSSATSTSTSSSSTTTQYWG